MCRLTLMPARRAASGLPPTANVRRPKVVRLSTTQPMTATSAKMMTSSGMPNTSCRKKSVKPGHVDDLGPSLGDDLGQTTSGGQHGQRGDERHHPAVGDQQAVDQAAAHPDDQGDERPSRSSGCPRASDWVARVVAQTEDRATIAPTDRSMPPPVITNVIPIETTPITEASRRMVSALSMLANCSPAVHDPDEAEHDERDDQAQVAPDRGAEQHAGEARCARGRCRTGIPGPRRPGLSGCR